MAEKKILIVDDEEDILKALEIRLSKAGYQVLKAINGEQAIITAQTQRPHLIILDIIMPGMKGTEVASILREDERTKSIPIIFLTCIYNKEDEEARGHISGTQFFIAKPFDNKELLRIIETTIL